MTQTDDNKSKRATKELDYCASAKKELQALPLQHSVSFIHNLEFVCNGMQPSLKLDFLDDIEPGVIELKRNGKPAFRCIYYTKIPGKVYLVWAGKKTTNGSDPQIKNVVRLRIKALRQQLGLI